MHAVIPKHRVYLATDRAICVAPIGLDSRSQRFERLKSWIPRAFLSHEENDLNELNDEGDLVIPQFVAEREGFIDYDLID